MERPPLTSNITTNQLVSFPWATWFNHLWTIVSALDGHGPTNKRPTTDLYIGRQYFDETLGKPVFIKSLKPTTVWVDSTGLGV
jgi:hypothetical protein